MILIVCSHCGAVYNYGVMKNIADMNEVYNTADGEYFQCRACNKRNKIKEKYEINVSILR